MRRSVVLLGAGVMGRGLARHFHGAGFNVAVIDSDSGRLADLQAALSGIVCAGAIGALDPAWQRPALVIEALPEQLELKHRILAEAEAFFDADVLIASNTSALTTAALSAKMHHPERLAIAHFFNPADVIPVVELIASATMPPARLNEIADLLAESGKEPAIVQREIPGFVANRIQHAMMRECLHLLDEGVADAEAIDRIVRWSLGVRLAFSGPFRQRDLNGLDTHLNIAGYLYPELSIAQSPSEALSSRVRQGALGRKSGQGFYDWDAENEAQAVADERALRTLIESQKPQVVRKGTV